jgi:hypothetical protein
MAGAETLGICCEEFLGRLLESVVWWHRLRGRGGRQMEVSAGPKSAPICNARQPRFLDDRLDRQPRSQATRVDEEVVRRLWMDGGPQELLSTWPAWNSLRLGPLRF